MKPKICILSFSPIAWDARVLREIEAASEWYDVDVIGYGKWEDRDRDNVRFFSLPKTKTSIVFALSKYMRVPLGYLNPEYWEAHFWQKREYHLALEILVQEKYDLIHANDWDSLPLAAHAGQQVDSLVLFDAHEYTPAQASDNLRVKLFNLPVRVFLLKKYQKWITKAITVSDGLSNLYHQNFDLASEVIMNAPYYVKSEFRSVNSDEIQLIHHGGAMRGRHLEDFIYLMELLDSRFRMNFMLMASEVDYLRRLRSLANRVSLERVIFHEPVPPRDINNILTKFDIGIPLIRANTLSYINALPNKFFDYIMAGLSIAVSPLPSMKKIIEKHGIGVIAEDQSISVMAERLNSLTAEKINQFKKNSLELAQTLNAETEMKKLMQIYDELLVK